MIQRVTCPACSLQFEPSSKRVRCPVCGTPVQARRAGAGSMPPLPVGLRQHRVAPGSVPASGELRGWVMGASAFLMFVATMLVLAAASSDNDTYMLVAAPLALLFLTSGVVSKGWREGDETGLWRFFIELPVYVFVLGILTLVVWTFAEIIYGLTRVYWPAAVFSLACALVLGLAGFSQAGDIGVFTRSRYSRHRSIRANEEFFDD